MKTRRTALSYLTGGAVAVGALMATGGLMRSCAPVPGRISKFEIPDMQNGEMRGYAIANLPMVLIKQDDRFRALDARCPNGFGWIVIYDSVADALFCGHCTRLYDRQGQIVDRNGEVVNERFAKPLKRIDLNIDDTTLLVAEDQAMPRQIWSSL